MPFRFAPTRRWAAAVVTAGLLAAAPGTHAESVNPTPDPAPTDTDRITANIAAGELRAMGYQPEISTDDRGMPHIVLNVDKYRWGILFYTCAPANAPADRRCGSMQFYSGYTMQPPVSTVTMNKWNTEKRFARGYAFTTSEGKPGARVEVDVYFTNTGADPKRMFRGYFSIMKIQAADFRKLIKF